MSADLKPTPCVSIRYHIQTVELLADCAAGNKSLQQFTALVSFERSVKEYVDCGAGSSRFDELQAAEARNQAESTGAFGNRSAGLPPLSNPEKSPSGMSGSRWALGQRHILSVLTVKAAWLRYLTRAYLEYDFVSEAKAKGGDMSSLVGTMRGFVWPDGSDGGADGMYTDRAGGSDSESNSENEGEGDDGPCTTDFRLETDIPSKSILEALALDVENARSWKQSYEQVRNAEVELQAKDAPWSLTPAAGDRRVPDGWESGLFVSEFVADTVASAVRACFENPAFSADEDSSGDQGGAESTRSRQDVSRSERERRDELRMRLGRAIVDFVNDVHAPPMRTAQILALNDLVERYLDPRGELPKIQVNRPEAKRDIELADGTSADSEPRRGARPDGKRVFNFRRFIYARVKEGFLDWSDAFAAAAGVHDTARGLGVGTGASATLFLSPVGQLFMPYVTTSLRVLAACLRHRDLQTLRGGNNASNDLRAAQVTLPFDLVAHAASLGLNCERASVAKAALQADKRGLFKTVLRVFRAMIYVNAAAGEHDTAINAEEAVEQMLCEQPASGDALETTIATALSPQWGLHRVALSFVGLKGMAIPAMRLLVTLLGGAESMGGVQGLAEAQDAILAHAHSSEGATLTAQLQLQMCSVISWAAAHRKTRSLVGAMRSLGTDSEQKDGQNSVIFANGELFEAALMGGSGAMNRLNNTLRGPRNSTVGVSQARWSNRASARNSVLAGGGSPSTPRGRRSSRSSTGFIGPGAMVGNALGLNAPRSPFRQRKFRIFSVPDASAVRGSYPADQKGRRQSKPDMWKAFDAAQLNVVEMAASKLGELRDTNDEASTDMRAAVADHVTTTHDALEQLRFLLLLCRGGHRGIQDWLRSPPRLTPPQDESSDPSVASGLLGLRHLSGDTPPSVSAPPSQSEGPEKSGKENSMDKRLRPSVLESVIAVLEPLVHGLDPADVTEMDLALAALEMLRLLTQGNSRSRDTAVKAGQLRLISRVLTIIGNHTARQHFRVASRRPGDEVDEDEADMRLSVSLNNAENKRASFTVDSPRRRRSSADQRFGPTEDRTAQRRGSNDSRETVGSTTPEPSKGTVKELSSRELLIAHHAHAARGSALRILLSVLQSHGGQRLAPAIMRLVPASVLVGVMHASAVSIVAARDDGQPAFAAVDDEAARLHQQTLVVAEMTDEGFIAYNVLETLLAVGEARMRRAKLGAVTVSSNTAHVGNASDGLVPGRSTSVKGEGTEDEVAARYLDRARVALAVPAIRQAVRNIFKAETGRVEIVAQHIAGSDESSNQDGAVPELMVFRKHKLALQLLNEDRWRTQTLARLSSIPRGDAVSHGVKRKALLAKIDELALEEIAAASFATHRYALVLLQILPPLLACLLNFLTVWCIRVDFDRSWIFADDVRPDHSDPVRIRSNDLPVCNSISILQPMLGAAYSILMIARVAVALGMRRPVLERQWQQHCETAFGVDDEEGDAGDDELEQRMYHQKIIVTGVTGVSQWARVVQLIAPAIGATCGFETIFAVFAVGGVIVGHSGAGGLQFAPVCYSILLLDLARARSTGFVLRSVGGSLRLIAGLLTLLMIVMFIFMSFALASFPGQLECETMLTCVTRGAVFMLLGKSPLMQETNVNIKSGLELDPLLIKPNDGYEVRDNDTRYGWVALNVASFVLLVLLLNSLLTGIIFNQFAKQTDKADALQRDARDVCLVCSLRRGAFEHATAGAGGGSAASAWRAHTLIDHNPIEYVALAISLRLRQTEAHLDEMTSHERYALERLLAHDASVIPIEQCASLASAGREKNTDTQVKELAAQVQLLAASVVGLQGQIKALVAGSHAPPTPDL